MLAPPTLPLQVLGCEHQNTKIQQHDCGSEESAKLLDCAGWLDYFRALYTPELRPHLLTRDVADSERSNMKSFLKLVEMSESVLRQEVRTWFSTFEGTQLANDDDNEQQETN